jgi:hypothetical protein
MAQPVRYLRCMPRETQARIKLLFAVLLSVVLLSQINCGSTSSGGGGGGGVTISVVPQSVSLLLGATQQFQAVFTGTVSAVTWEVNGVVGGSTAAGTISAAGLYTAPSVLPSPPEATVTAVTQSNPPVSGSASVTLSDDIAISVSPPTATVPTGGAQVFTAMVTDDVGPAVSLMWSVNGIAGGNSTLGTIVASSATTAIYTAPAAPPAPPTVTITAASTADSSKFGSATATVTCTASNAVSPPSASVPLAQTKLFTASFCLAAGATITWDVNGVTGGNSTLGTVTPSTVITAVYTAPADLPPTNPVTIHATVPASNGNPALSASASVTVTSGVTISVSPPSATLSVGQRTSLTANVTGTPDASVTWFVNGVANGNTPVGQICRTGTNPCAAPTGPAAGSVDFLAPAVAPAIDPVTVAAVSFADPSRSGTSSITISGATGAITVAISPVYAFLPPSTGTPSRQQFAATVTGSSNTTVTWGVSGQGCAGAACGSVNAGGLFTAPPAAPSPNAISVVATSGADPTKSASATIALTGAGTSAPAIEVLLPSSATAGAVEGFPLAVQGANFVAGSGASASVILINGAARSTTCASATSCITALAPTDLQTAGTLTIQIRNPGNPTALSNPVPFVILPFNASAGTTSLTTAQPLQTSQDILVTEPTTTAASSPINVAAAGPFASGKCTLQGSPITVTRPASGTSVTSICVYGNDLDPAFAYTFTSPSESPSGDIGVSASSIPGLLPGMIELDLQIASTTAPGLRTLFITTVNNDRAVATGILEVQ